MSVFDLENLIIYENGGVLPNEWQCVRPLEVSKIFFYKHRLALSNRGWLLSRYERNPPWILNGRVTITGFAQLNIIFRCPGIAIKTTNRGNTQYGVRATIGANGEFGLETLRLKETKSVRGKISTVYGETTLNDNRNDLASLSHSEAAALTSAATAINSHIAQLAAGMEESPQQLRYTSNGPFILPHRQELGANQHSIYSFEICDYGGGFPIIFKLQRLSPFNGEPLSKVESLSMQVCYPRDELKFPYYNYIVLNSNQLAKWPLLIDRLILRTQQNSHILLPFQQF